MAKKQKKIVVPRFTLPGDDSFSVQWIAYGQGLNATSTIFFMNLPPGSPLPDGYISSFPTEQAEMEDMSHQVSELMLTIEADEQPVTNSPELFKTLFSESYIKGYRFRLYAFQHGLINIESNLPPERRFELASRFACELITDQPTPDKDIVIIQALDELQAIYKQYRALN